jgi:hypothetical protein
MTDQPKITASRRSSSVEKIIPAISEQSAIEGTTDHSNHCTDQLPSETGNISKRKHHQSTTELSDLSDSRERPSKRKNTANRDPLQRPRGRPRHRKRVRTTGPVTEGSHRRADLVANKTQSERLSTQDTLAPEPPSAYLSQQEAMPDSSGSSKKGDKSSRGKGGKKDSGSGGGRKSRENSIDTEQADEESSSQRGRSRSGYN